MNGQGYFWIGRTWHEVYWSAIALILVIVAFAIWPRGTEARYRPRLARLYRRLKGPAGTFGALALAIALTTGSWIFYNTTILNDLPHARSAGKAASRRRTRAAEIRKAAAAAHRRHALNVALYPHDTRAVTTGDYVIENRSGTTLTEVHVNLPDELKIDKLEIDGATLEHRVQGIRLPHLQVRDADAARRTAPHPLQDGVGAESASRTAATTRRSSTTARS